MASGFHIGSSRSSMNREILRMGIKCEKSLSLLMYRMTAVVHLFFFFLPYSSSRGGQDVDLVEKIKKSKYP